ncbi:MAG: response regulator [Ginsengibacter sp.]
MGNHVLIYDDEAEILQVSKIILERHKYQVQTRDCCENILEDIRAEKPGIILLDLHVPPMGGEHTLRLLKDGENTRDIPVILFSGLDGLEDISIDLKADGYLKKPFGINELLDTIKKYITAPLLCYLLL